MKITYLYHSGFAVETDKHFLVFDYWRNTPKNGNLADGVINPNEIVDKDVIVFSSHLHGDHYNKVIHEWQKVIKKCRIVLSDDIPEVKGSTMVSPNMTYEEDDFALATLKSTDEGVAFIVDIDGYCIYHAGDLNWWHWEGEPGSWNDDVERDYKKEIDSINKEVIDLAFVPVDPRLEEQYAWGIDYFMRNNNVRHAVAMHFAKKGEVVERLLKDEISAPYRDRIVPLTVRGQSAEVE